MQMTPTTKARGVLKAKGARSEMSKIKPAARKDFVPPPTMLHTGNRSP
jgi:hypothetical protein